MNTYKRLAVVGVSVGMGMCMNHAHAISLMQSDDAHLDATIESMIGVFHSQESYAQTGASREGSAAWQEGYIKYGLKGGINTAGDMSYGAFSMLSSATWGDGDAGGFTDGSEHTTKIEDAYAGWK